MTAAALEGITAFPLAWPIGWTRTRRPREAPYRVSLSEALDELGLELRRMGARSIVVSTNIPARRDGLPRSGLGEPEDHGAAVYWLAPDGKPMVMACDCWTKVRANVRAIGLAVSALRAIERSGASQLLERAYTGFAALPAQASTTSSWRSVLGVSDQVISREVLEQIYKRMVRIAHPDLGGSHEQMVQVNRAYQDALRELG